MVRIAIAQYKLDPVDFRWQGTSQILSHVDKTLSNLEAIVHKAGELSCDVLGFSEDTLGLGHWEAAHEEALGDVLPIACERMLERLGNAAASHRMYLICCCDTHSPGWIIHNTAFFLGRDGKEKGRYHKVSLPISERGKKQGGSFPVFKTPDLGNVGILICHDIKFPEPARCLALNGADIIFVPTMGGAAFGGEDASLAAFRTRATENFVYLAVAFRGRGSMIISPKGEVISRAETSHKLTLAEIDPFSGRDGEDAFDSQEDMRTRLFRDRVPQAYGILCDPHPPALDRLPLKRPVEESVRIATGAMTVGSVRFEKAETLMKDGKAQEASSEFETLMAEYPGTWIERASKSRLKEIR